jgi:hypothetical protein
VVRVLSQSSNKKLNWFTNPQPNHLVHIYPYDSALSASLVEYIRAGLEADDTCAVMATEKRIQKLNAELESQGIDVAAAIQSGQYIIYDAEDALASVMQNGKLDHKELHKVVEGLVKLTSGRGKPVRTFGEMVALLWKQSNLDAVIEVEKYWNDITQKHNFSVYCAYPDLYFDGSAEHKEIINKIYHCHSLATHSAGL